MNVRRKKKALISAGKNAFIYLILSITSISFVLPFLWMISTSLKSNAQLWTPEMVWIPDPILWSNYYEAFTALPFFTYFRNTFFVVICSVLGQVFACSMAGYGFARLRFPGKNVLFVILLSTMMIPGIITLIPQFIYFSKLHMVNTFLPLILP